MYIGLEALHGEVSMYNWFAVTPRAITTKAVYLYTSVVYRRG